MKNALYGLVVAGLVAISGGCVSTCCKPMSGSLLGGGCTSGHGVCGVAQLSIRSIVATIVFLAAGMVTVFIMRHVIGVV